MSGALRKIEIVHAGSSRQIEQVRTLFIEYAQSLGFSLCFQGFDEELAGLPGKYAPPSGRLLLALRDGQPAGCVGLRVLDDRVCEMKRLYVRPECRGLQIGRLLADAIIKEAKAIGYSAMRLDRLRSMTTAKSIYQSFGFREIPPYYNNPLEGVEYLELRLE
ncbi:MAG TPA: GNAT family N-acetyltransferase [Burkholderiales bacterium]|nr:GNAT family N-acetyltransferase [Burkholderiales bacterium]